MLLGLLYNTCCRLTRAQQAHSRQLVRCMSFATEQDAKKQLRQQVKQGLRSMSVAQMQEESKCRTTQAHKLDELEQGKMWDPTLGDIC